jgi:hypothetical protein
MGKVSKDATGEPVAAPGFEGRYGETEGYTIGFEKYTDHADLTPFFVGLPDDRCQSPHWGYVLAGKLVYHTADGDIEITDGEAYYVGPGHTPEIYPGDRDRRVQPDGGLPADDGRGREEHGVDGIGASSNGLAQAGPQVRSVRRSWRSFPPTGTTTCPPLHGGLAVRRGLLLCPMPG